MTDQILVTDNPVPVDGDLADEIRAELRSAREVLAVIASEEGGANPPTPSLNNVAHPRLHGLSSDQLQDHIERLQRDLDDAKARADGYDGFEAMGDADSDDGEMVDSWQLDVDGLFVGLAFRVSLGDGATLVTSTCECGRDDCAHVEVAEARVRHRFGADDDAWGWEDERDRLGLPDVPVAIKDAPAQWSSLNEEDTGENENDGKEEGRSNQYV